MKKLTIKVINCTKEKPKIRADNIITENDKGKKVINYPEFVKVFKEHNPCIYCNGIFYTPDGVISAGNLRKKIVNCLISLGWTQKLDTPTTSIFNTLKDLSTQDEFIIPQNLIPFKNGDLIIKTKDNWEFREDEKAILPYRLKATFKKENINMPNFDKWIKGLFDEEDIPTIQEMLGYSLLPTTASQESFIIIGDGGEGKSILGTILEEILGEALEPINTQDMIDRQFHLPLAENKLVIYDDDLGKASLSKTGTLKKLITSKKAIPAERKYKDPFKFIPYCKVIACSNYMITSLYDKSDGFYRRLHPIKVKQLDKKRIDDPLLDRKITKDEISHIVNWSLIGLHRLMNNNWKIHWSTRSTDYLKEKKNASINFNDFITETLIIDKESDVSSTELKSLYERWCFENGLSELSYRTLSSWLKDNIKESGGEASNKIIRNHKKVRGFKGLRIKPEWLDDG